MFSNVTAKPINYLISFWLCIHNNFPVELVKYSATWKNEQYMPEHHEERQY